MDGFWRSKCQNYSIDVPNKIGSFSSGATTSMVVKNGTKKLLFLCFFKVMIPQPPAGLERGERSQPKF